MTHHRNFDFPNLRLVTLIIGGGGGIMKYSTVFYFRMWPLTISMGEIMRPLCCPQKKGP